MTGLQGEYNNWYGCQPVLDCLSVDEYVKECFKNDIDLNWILWK